MSISRPLKDEFFKYRKRNNLSLDGSISGLPRNTYRRSRRYVTGDLPLPSSPAMNFTYNSFTPREYHPWINSPAVRNDEYLPEEDEFFDGVRSSRERILRPFPDLGPRKHFITREERRTMNEFFLKVMEEQYKPYTEGEEVRTPAQIWMELFSHEPLSPGQEDVTSTPSTVDPHENDSIEECIEQNDEQLDYYPSLSDLTDAFTHLDQIFPPEHQDLVNLRSAMREILGFEELWPELEANTADDNDQEVILPLSDNDSVREQAKQIFDQQMRFLGMEFEGADAQAPQISPDGHEQSQDWTEDGFTEVSAFPDTFAEPEPIDSLEHAVAQSPEPQFDEMAPLDYGPSMSPGPDMSNGMNAAFHEIDGAIDEAVQTPDQQQEPDFFQMEFDMMMQDQYMFDPIYMPDYMHPPMMLPGPGFGPMGPGFGPMMGPM